MEVKVSVIIPVYQAMDFVEEAVLSALNFPEVGEIILIEDGSNDESYLKCKELELSHDLVRLLIHSNRENRGASASRNLGIKLSKFPFVVFLDADDYFLPNRFNIFRKFLNSAVEFDGIYEPIQYFNGSDKVYGITKQIPPKQLFHYLIRGTYGHFHTNGLIIKKAKLIKAGLFNESLRLHQDSDLWLKLSFYGKLISGDSGVPVAMVRKHEGNRIWIGTSNASRYKQLRVTWSWAKREKVGIVNKLLIIKKLFKLRIAILIGF